MTQPQRVLARKARKSSRVACGCYIRTGERIIRLDGRWICIGCALTAAGYPAAPETRTAP